MTIELEDAAAVALAVARAASWAKRSLVAFVLKFAAFLALFASSRSLVPISSIFTKVFESSGAAMATAAIDDDR